MAETKQIVFPGEVLEISEIKPRNGVYKNKEGKYCSEYFGTVQKGDDYIDVVPFTGHYFPRRGDKVIGKIIEIGPSMWTIDINSPYLNLMHMNDTPWKMSSGDIKRYLGIGEYIYAKVMTLNIFSGVPSIQISPFCPITILVSVYSFMRFTIEPPFPIILGTFGAGTEII